VPRTAVYAVANPDTVPQALMHNLKHNHVLHEHNLILTVVFPRGAVDPVRAAGAGHAPGARLLARAGELRLHQHARHSQGAGALPRAGRAINLFETSYFLSREIVVPTRNAGMAHWREALFAVMSRNAGSVADFFRLPHNCVIELGTRVQI
jgi:KUP system potassium uptake protein